jgi:hypothetical protein
MILIGTIIFSKALLSGFTPAWFLIPTTVPADGSPQGENRDRDRDGEKLDHICKHWVGGIGKKHPPSRQFMVGASVRSASAEIQEHLPTGYTTYVMFKPSVTTVSLFKINNQSNLHRFQVECAATSLDQPRPASTSFTYKPTVRQGATISNRCSLVSNGAAVHTRASSH